MAPGPVEEFEEQRHRLLGLAYRLLGSAHEAEEVVQEAFLRWNAADRIDVPSAWLAKVVTNLCLNRLTSAAARREEYVGPWLPEPVLTSDGALGPLETAEQRDSVAFGLLVLLERLTPVERAVFVLREAFVYSHREIAELLGLTEANCRQLHRRARQRVDAGPRRFHPGPGERHRLVERFLAAARDGDVHALEQLLAADVVSWADGGGKARAARRPISGRARVVRYLLGGMGKFARDMDITIVEVNGAPSVVGWSRGRLAGVLVPELVAGRSEMDARFGALRIVVNPDKLTVLSRQLAEVSRVGGLSPTT